MWFFILINCLIFSWMLYCNNRTSKMRKNLRDMIFLHRQSIDKDIAWKYYGKVSYGQHLFAVICMKNPWLLYPTALMAVMIT